MPEISKAQPTLLVVIDNLRYDQWKAFESLVSELFYVEKENNYIHEFLKGVSQKQLVSKNKNKSYQIKLFLTSVMRLCTCMDEYFEIVE